MQVWDTILRFLDSHGRCALVTLVEAQGSTPREPGARMIVRPDGGFVGTIGGGSLEWRALQEAQAALAKGTPGFALRSFALGPALGQCCGGRVLVGVEVLTTEDRANAEILAHREAEGRLVTILRPAANSRTERRAAAPDEAAWPGPGAERRADGSILERFGEDLTPLWLFGAGHVGRALALALAPLPFRVTWLDPRPDSFPSHVPANVTPVPTAQPVAALDDAPAGAFVAVMTHSHALDLDIVARALALGRFPYVGLIGSDTKRARFATRLRELGLGDRLSRLTCPIGIPGIESKLPAAIAAAVAAELLILRDRLAARRRPDPAEAADA